MRVYSGRGRAVCSAVRKCGESLRLHLMMWHCHLAVIYVSLEVQAPRFEEVLKETSEEDWTSQL